MPPVDQGNLSPPVVSPDGRTVALVSRVRDGAQRLWVQSLGGGPPRELAGTDNSLSIVGTFSASDNGVLVYAAPMDRQQTLRWFDRTGRPLETLGSGDFEQVRLAPDGRRVVAAMTDLAAGTRSLWLLEPDRPPVRLTGESGWETLPRPRVRSPAAARAAGRRAELAGVVVREVKYRCDSIDEKTIRPVRVRSCDA
jgi:hypothetical protein